MREFVGHRNDHVHCHRWNEAIKQLNIRVARVRKTYSRNPRYWGFYGVLASWFYGGGR